MKVTEISQSIINTIRACNEKYIKACQRCSCAMECYIVPYKSYSDMR